MDDKNRVTEHTDMASSLEHKREKDAHTKTKKEQAQQQRRAYAKRKALEVQHEIFFKYILRSIYYKN